MFFETDENVWVNVGKDWELEDWYEDADITQFWINQHIAEKPLQYKQIWDFIEILDKYNETFIPNEYYHMKWSPYDDEDDWGFMDDYDIAYDEEEDYEVPPAMPMMRDSHEKGCSCELCQDYYNWHA